MDYAGVIHRYWPSKKETALAIGLALDKSQDICIVLAGLGSYQRLQEHLVSSNYATYIKACMHINTYLNPSIQPSIHSSTQPSIPTYIHTYIHTYIQSYIQMYVGTHVRTYIHAYRRTAKETYRRTDTQT